MFFLFFPFTTRCSKFPLPPSPRLRRLLPGHRRGASTVTSKRVHAVNLDTYFPRYLPGHFREPRSGIKKKAAPKTAPPLPARARAAPRSFPRGRGQGGWSQRCVSVAALGLVLFSEPEGGCLLLPSPPRTLRLFPMPCSSPPFWTLRGRRSGAPPPV